jgi:hypothetical protein
MILPAAQPAISPTMMSHKIQNIAYLLREDSTDLGAV